MGILVDHVHKSFGQTQVLRDVSVSVDDGEFVVVVGPSGCGKSTLLRIVSGLESAQSGHVSLDGRLVDSLPPYERNVGMVFQNYALYPHMTVFDNLSFGLSAHRVPRPDIQSRVAQVARLLEIGHLLDRRPGALSGGQRQRVALGRALVRDPHCFLMDEPLSNLDAMLRDRMRIELRALHERLRIPTIYVTHDQAEAMTLADRIVVMRDGQVVQTGRPDEVYDNPATTFVAQFLGSPPMNIVPVRLGRGQPGWVLADAGGDADAVAALPAEVGDWLADACGTDRDLFVGVRPEAVTVGGSEGLQLHAVCELVEHLGSRIHGHMRWGKERLVAVDHSRAVLRVGEAVRVAMRWTDLYWFDPDGKRIEPAVRYGAIAEGVSL